MLALALPAYGAATTAIISPTYIEGYTDALLQRNLGWSAGNYRLTFRSGYVVVTPPPTWKGSGMTILLLLQNVPGIVSVRVQRRAGQATRTRSAASNPEERPFILTGGEYFPRGSLFHPLFADPKEPEFFVSYREYRMPFGTYHVGAVGYGGTLGLYRWTQRLLSAGKCKSISRPVHSRNSISTLLHPNWSTRTSPSAFQSLGDGAPTRCVLS